MLGPGSIQGKGSLAQVTEEWDGRRGPGEPGHPEVGSGGTVLRVLGCQCGGFVGFLLRRKSREMSGTKLDISDGFRQKEIRVRF